MRKMGSVILFTPRVMSFKMSKILSFRLNVVNKKLTWTPAKNHLFLLQCQILSLRTIIVYENFIFTREYAFAERCCFLTFSFEGKFRKYYISVKRKQTKTNENMIFSVMFIRKFFDFHKKINYCAQLIGPG